MANARIRVNKGADLVLKTLELKILDQPHEDLLITTNSQITHYEADEDASFSKMHYYSWSTMETLAVSNVTKASYKNSFWAKCNGTYTENLVDIPESPGKDSLIDRIITTQMAQQIKKWVTSWNELVNESKIDNKFTHPNLQNLNKHVIGPEDPMQIVLVP